MCEIFVCVVEKSAARTSAPEASSDIAQKKFGGAKAISSDQFFNDDQSSNYETQANLVRFQGSSSISSSEFFGNGRGIRERVST